MQPNASCVSSATTSTGASQPGVADGAGVDALTQRELEIARRIVDRRTNRQIAEELFLSPKTVETHIRNIFAKLGADSRVEVARIVERAAGWRARGHKRGGIRAHDLRDMSRCGRLR